MQHDFFGSSHDLDLRSNFKHDLSWSNYTSLDASRQEKHHAGKINVVSLLSQSCYRKKTKKTLFLEFLLSRGHTVDLRLNLRTYQRKNVLAIECAFSAL